MLGGSREFVRKYPVATKRAARAILKAADLCATDPARAAQRMVDGGFTPPVRLCPPGAERAALRQMAGIRRRGRNAVLGTAPARSRLDQIKPADDHRRRHPLAFSERTQTRVEGVRRWGAGVHADDA